MAKTLQLTFLTAGDKKVTLSVDEPKIGITEEEVVAAMEEMIQTGIFEIDDYPFASAVSAKIVERSVTDLFLA